MAWKNRGAETWPGSMLPGDRRVQLLYPDMPVPLHQALSVGVAPAGVTVCQARCGHTGPKHPSAGHIYAPPRTHSAITERAGTRAESVTER